MQGTVFAIERCALHDGPGIRTTVFLKGCPLQCLWCHNPESQSATPVVYSLYEKCAQCGACVAVCPHGCHVRAPDGHIAISRTACAMCGACVQACPNAALEIKGITMSVENVLAVVRRDRAYYETSGGGMTLSGGEPLAQYTFSAALLSAAQAEGIHTCVETCGYGLLAHMAHVAAHTDLFYFDIKETDPERHRDYTGVDNAGIIKNLAELDRLGKTIVLRCPIVPGLNERQGHFEGLAALANRFTHVTAVHLLAYHPMGSSKLKRIGMPERMASGTFVEDGQLKEWAERVRALTDVPVVTDSDE